MVDEFIWRAASNVDSSSCRAKFLNFRKSHPSLNGELAQAKPAIPQHEFLSSVLARGVRGLLPEPGGGRTKGQI